MQRLNPQDRKLFIDYVLTLNPDELDISAYTSIYFKKHLACLTYTVNLAWQIIELGLSKIDKPVHQISIAEIGGGTGILSLLAKWLGFGNVIYSDTFVQSCKDFEFIASAISLKPNAIVCGSVDELAVQFANKIDLLVSRDVIEHIYDPKLFFTQSIQSFGSAIMVHNTSANGYNIFKKSYFAKLHKLDEHFGNPNQFKPGDSLESFYQLRLNFIATNFPELSDAQHLELAKNTRGRIYKDIMDDVGLYKSKGILPQLLPHPTNTCDPNNGNWTENLMSFSCYESFLFSGGYKVDWFFAPYDEWSNKGIKYLIIKLLNQLIFKAKFIKRYISPAFILVASPSASIYEHKA